MTWYMNGAETGYTGQTAPVEVVKAVEVLPPTQNAPGVITETTVASTQNDEGDDVTATKVQQLMQDQNAQTVLVSRKLDTDRGVDEDGVEDKQVSPRYEIWGETSLMVLISNTQN